MARPPHPRPPRGSAGDVAAAVRVIVEDYALSLDLKVRALAQEHRYPAFKPVNDTGRVTHRSWTEHVFAPRLGALAPDARRVWLDSLATMNDLHVWEACSPRHRPSRSRRRLR